MEMSSGSAFSGEVEKFVQCEYFQKKGGSLDMDVCTFWRKNIGFFKIYGLSARSKGERSRTSADILQTMGEGTSFSRFCTNDLYGRLLMTLLPR